MKRKGSQKQDRLWFDALLRLIKKACIAKSYLQSPGNAEKSQKSPAKEKISDLIDLVTDFQNNKGPKQTLENELKSYVRKNLANLTDLVTDFEYNKGNPQTLENELKRRTKKEITELTDLVTHFQNKKGTKRTLEKKPKSHAKKKVADLTDLVTEFQNNRGSKQTLENELKSHAKKKVADMPDLDTHFQNKKRTKQTLGNELKRHAKKKVADLTDLAADFQNNRGSKQTLENELESRAKKKVVDLPDLDTHFKNKKITKQTLENELKRHAKKKVADLTNLVAEFQNNRGSKKTLENELKRVRGTKNKDSLKTNVENERHSSDKWNDPVKLIQTVLKAQFKLKADTHNKIATNKRREPLESTTDRDLEKSVTNVMLEKIHETWMGSNKNLNPLKQGNPRPRCTKLTSKDVRRIPVSFKREFVDMLPRDSNVQRNNPEQHNLKFKKAEHMILGLPKDRMDLTNAEMLREKRFNINEDGCLASERRAMRTGRDIVGSIADKYKRVALVLEKRKWINPQKKTTMRESFEDLRRYLQIKEQEKGLRKTKVLEKDIGEFKTASKNIKETGRKYKNETRYN